MLWRRRDMGSDPLHPIYVTTDIPTIGDDQFVDIRIPVAAYKRLVDWCSLGRTLDNVRSCLADGSPDEERTHLAWSEMEDISSALCEIHSAVRAHYTALPGRHVEDE